MTKKTSKNEKRSIPALKVHQWMDQWSKVKFSKKNFRKKPEPYFYIFSLKARDLKLLSGIYRRNTTSTKARYLDLGIQRRHEDSRSKNIKDFIQYGYPWSDLNKANRSSGKYNDLLKPGWLPTSIVVNILQPDDKRIGLKVDSSDLITIDSRNKHVSVVLPDSFSGEKWEPKNIPPIEVIDGQHRLFAFDEDLENVNYELPVVAFYGLDISWQAYLFWSINIKPKKINPSLAFDLYPLLRHEDWLDKIEGHKVYKETRAQELTESLWLCEESPWYQWINMLGDSGPLTKVTVSQAAWVRALLSTYVKSSEGKGVKIGGIFGAPVGETETMLPWSRAQQAAFIIFLWSEIVLAIGSSKLPWSSKLRALPYPKGMENDRDLAVYGQHSLLTKDQGVRAILSVTNDILFLASDNLLLHQWVVEEEAAATDCQAVARILNDLNHNKKISLFVRSLSKALSQFDWRSSSAPDLSEKQRILKTSFRGGSGYREFRLQLFRHIAKSKSKAANYAKQALKLYKLS